MAKSALRTAKNTAIGHGVGIFLVVVGLALLVIGLIAGSAGVAIGGVVLAVLAVGFIIVNAIVGARKAYKAVTDPKADPFAELGKAFGTGGFSLLTDKEKPKQ